jgi:hypothetical protein
MYEQWPVFWTILKYYQWYLKKVDPFSELPVVIKFPIPTLANQDGDSPDPWIKFEWQCYEPSDDSVEGWQDMKVDTTNFASVYFREDVICIDYLKRDHPHYRPTHPSLNSMAYFQDKYDHVIQLCDPSVNFDKTITKWAFKGLQGFGRWLEKIGEHW